MEIFFNNIKSSFRPLLNHFIISSHWTEGVGTIILHIEVCYHIAKLIYRTIKIFLILFLETNQKVTSVKGKLTSSTQLRRGSIRKAKVQQELRLARDNNGNKNSLHCYSSCKRIHKENVVPVVNGVGDLVIVLVWAGIELIFIIIACTVLFLIWDQNTANNTRMLWAKAHTASRSFLPSHTALSVNRLGVHKKLWRKATRTADPNWPNYIPYHTTSCSASSEFLLLLGSAFSFCFIC